MAASNPSPAMTPPTILIISIVDKGSSVVVSVLITHRQYGAWKISTPLAIWCNGEAEQMIVMFQGWKLLETVVQDESLKNVWLILPSVWLHEYW